MADRSAEEEARVLSGHLQIIIGGVAKEMPTLPIKYVPEWLALLGSGPDSAKPVEEWTMADVSTLSGASATRLLDLAVAYDRTAALGGREWLEEHADAQQLYAAVVQMVGNANPLADDPAGLLGLMLVRSVVPSGPPKSTSGASPTGASTRRRSGRASIRSS